jgi:hypothetical protein
LDKGTSKLAQGCAAQTCLIQVEKFNGAIPEVKAFEPPIMLERSSLEGINHVKLPSSMIAGSLP